MCYHSLNRVPQKPESFESSSLFSFKPWEKILCPSKDVVAEVKLPLRKSNVWISVKVDMETHLRLLQASREEIKPEMDVLVTRGRAAVGQQVGTPLGWGVGTDSRQEPGAGHPGTRRAATGKLIFILFCEALPVSSVIHSGGRRSPPGAPGGGGWGRPPLGAPPPLPLPTRLPTGGCKSHWSVTHTSGLIASTMSAPRRLKTYVKPQWKQRGFFFFLLFVFWGFVLL